MVHCWHIYAFEGSALFVKQATCTTCRHDWIWLACWKSQRAPPRVAKKQDRQLAGRAGKHSGKKEMIEIGMARAYNLLLHTGEHRFGLLAVV